MLNKISKPLLRILLAATTLHAASCGRAPTFTERLDESFEGILKSVEGPWKGRTTSASITSPPLANTIDLEFFLTQQSTGQLQGVGTMKEADAAGAIAISVTATFQRPTLALTFAGMVYEGRSVTGTFRGDYTGISGISESLRLTADGYDKSIAMFLEER